VLPKYGKVDEQMNADTGKSYRTQISWKMQKRKALEKQILL